MSYATPQELATALGIALTAGNTESLQACIDAAAVEIDHYVDVPLELFAPSAAWNFSTLTAETDPGPGAFRADRSQATAVQALYFNRLDADGVDHALGDLAVGDLLEIAAGSEWWRFTVTAVAIDQSGWFTIPADYESASLGAMPYLPSDGERATVYFFRPGRLASSRLALANRVNIVRGVEWWKSNQAAFGVIGFDQVGSLQAPRDSFLRHQKELVPLKVKFGVA